MGHPGECGLCEGLPHISRCATNVGHLSATSLLLALGSCQSGIAEFGALLPKSPALFTQCARGRTIRFGIVVLEERYIGQFEEVLFPIREPFTVPRFVSRELHNGATPCC